MGVAIQSDLEHDGFALVPGVLSSIEIAELRTSLGPISVAGRRGMLGVPEVMALANSARILDLLRSHLPAKPVPVRAIYFNKSAATNWLVAWHQDLTLAVRARAEVQGFGPWSTKDGVPHVRPPVALLEQMAAVRVHLDDADESNGALRVLKESHRFGRLSPEDIEKLREEREEVVCTASAGDILIMRPLILHASGRSVSDRSRRILHIEYAAFALPAGLDWHEAA